MLLAIPEEKSSKLDSSPAKTHKLCDCHSLGIQCRHNLNNRGYRYMASRTLSNQICGIGATRREERSDRRLGKTK
jgi:hypothetical protein